MASTLPLLRHRAGGGALFLSALARGMAWPQAALSWLRMLLETGKHPSAAGYARRCTGGRNRCGKSASASIASPRICGDTCACAEEAMGSAADTEAKPASARTGIEDMENLGMVIS